MVNIKAYTIIGPPKPEPPAGSYHVESVTSVISFGLFGHLASVGQLPFDARLKGKKSLAGVERIILKNQISETEPIGESSLS